MNLVAVLAIVLLCWGLITLVRRIAEVERRRVERGALRGRADRRTSGWADTRTSGHADDDEIDYEELRRAEEEVRDLGTDARAEDGFEGDDWGPGAPRNPPYL